MFDKSITQDFFVTNNFILFLQKRLNCRKKRSAHNLNSLLFVFNIASNILAKYSLYIVLKNLFTIQY